MLVSIFIVLGFSEWYFFIWACTAFFTKTVIVPWVLLKTAKKTKMYFEEPPLVSSILSVIIMIIAIGIGFEITRGFHADWFYIPFSVSITLFLIGLILLSSRRNALKQILGLCHFENGSHLTLAVLAPGLTETIEIGILTDAVACIIICCLLAKIMYDVLGTLDVSKLKLLKY